jgi:dTDP-L-rhamnose 4-epimerase
MKVLITGGAGFIGSHTADALLADGHEVRILDILDPQIHGHSGQFPEHLVARTECIHGDVRDIATVSAALGEVDAVYHFAAETGVGQSMYDIQSYVSTNCVGTATLLEAIIKSGRSLQRLVLSSSRAVYGEGTYRCPEHGIVYPPVRSRSQLDRGDFLPTCPDCGTPLTPVPTQENRPRNPVSVYGWTKKHQEDLCQYAAATFGIPVVMLRYFNVYGSRQSLQNPYTGVVTVFYNRIQAGKPSYLYEQGMPLRDFVHIRDIVQANIRALTATVSPGTPINVGSGHSQSIGEIALALSTALGHEALLQPNDEFRVGDIFACVADLARAHALLGYQPTIHLDAGMSEFVAWAGSQSSTDRYDITVQELSRHGLFGQAKLS